jgi:DNA-binding GntR family transcriptional regulator
MNKTEQAMALLQGMIERGELAPGSMLSERTIVDMMGLGRTPIREAIQRLAPSYMIKVHPSRGIEIPAITVEDQLSRLEVRRVVEILAVELACKRASPAQRQAMGDLAARLEGQFTLQEYTDTIRQTHALILEAAANPYLGSLMQPLQGLSRRFWVVHAREEAGDIARGRDLHRAILTAIAAADVPAATAASRALNGYLVEFALAVIARQAAR